VEGSRSNNLPLSEGRSQRAEGALRERCSAYRRTKTKAPLVVVQRHRIRSAKLLVDSLQHSIDLDQHFVIPEANDAISADLNQPGAPRILHCLLQMLPTIKLDHQLRARTCEVGYKICNGKLPPKSKITESSRAQTCPELGLCICLVTAQYACAMMQYWNRLHILSALNDWQCRHAQDLCPTTAIKRAEVCALSSTAPLPPHSFGALRPPLGQGEEIFIPRRRAASTAPTDPRAWSYRRAFDPPMRSAVAGGALSCRCAFSAAHR